MPTAVSEQSQPMQSDTNILVTLVFWLEAVVLVSLAIAWCWTRWGHRQTWFVGVPALLAVLWGATTAGAMLLPNLY
jgi:hypothetical protein